MAWPKPQYSKNKVRAAGKAILENHRQRQGNLLLHMHHPENLYIALNWRESHGAVLNTAQAWLRRLPSVQRPVVGQRLKRFSTILDKLTSERSRDLSTMNDIAGVRAIFRSEEQLDEFRSKMFESRAQHSLIHESDKFNYIKRPKASGYRGIHHVYSREVSAPSGKSWNGLRFEVQLRTAVQHAWATAIEVYDSTQQARFKFEGSENPAYEQFLIISEIFARVFENKSACKPELSDIELVQAHDDLENQTHMVSTIDSLNVADNYGHLKKDTILKRSKDGELFVYRFSSFQAAMRNIARIEQQPDTENAVLVSAATPNHIRDAFRNYFDDTNDFVHLLRDAIHEIKSS